MKTPQRVIPIIVTLPIWKKIISDRDQSCKYAIDCGHYVCYGEECEDWKVRDENILDERKQ